MPSRRNLSGTDTALGGTRVGVHRRFGLFSGLENGGPLSLKEVEVGHL